MKKYLLLSGVVAISSMFAISSFAQEGGSKKIKIKASKMKKGTFTAKMKHKGKLIQSGKATISYVAAGQACGTEGDQQDQTSKHKGTCSVLGQARPCECDVTVTFECKEGTYQGIKTSVGVCTVDDQADLSSALDRESAN